MPLIRSMLLCSAALACAPAYAVVPTPAIGVPANTAGCATASPVTTFKDIATLQADADCFGAAAADDKAKAAILTKAATAATAAQKYRLDRIVALKKLPPPTTITCPDGSIILATATCPAPPVSVLSVSSGAVSEDAGSIPLHLTRTGNLSAGVKFEWGTFGVTAISGVNFVSDSGSVTFGPGVSDIPVTVRVLRDNKVTSDLVLNVKVMNVGVGGTAGQAGTVTIHNVDQAAPAPVSQTCPDGTAIPATSTCPVPPVTTSLTDPTPSIAPSLSGVEPIASNFDINSEIIDAPIPLTAAPDTLGAFRFICGPGQVLPDDPVVHFREPGKSHLHQFYGNTSANANSTYESLRKSGISTCMSPANRSAYWMPAMLDGKGNVVRPDYVSIYYKRYPASSPQCTQGKVSAKGCVPLPNGLRFIMGRDMLNLAAPPTGNFHFLCDNNTGTFATLGGALAVCKPGNHIIAVIDAPMCWDGKNLDSPDHRSHMGYMIDSHNGYPMCDAAHPYIIPEFTMSANYSVVAGDDPTLWSFSSDAMAPNEPHGSTYHADWFGAWDPAILAMWTDNCINKLLNCSAGILGNGKQLKQSYSFTWSATPRLVPLTSIPWTVGQ
jgi:hypothetical protein